jgi:predicted RNase H-like HicB family nuclease
MEKILNIHIEKLPEGYYLATSESIQGLVAQGRTISETLEIARDIAKKLIEAQDNNHIAEKLTGLGDRFNYPLIVGL